MRCNYALLIVAGLLSLAGCASRHDSDEKYFLVTANKQVPYWTSAAAGLERAGREMRVPTEIAGPDSYDPKAEQEEFRRVVARKPSGILVSPADPNLFAPEIQAAVAQGIPVITIDSDAPSSKRLMFVGTNNYRAGTMGGEVAAKALKGRGNVAVFTMPGQANLDERLRGYKDVFAKSPGIKIAQVVDIKGDPRIAFDTTQQLLGDKKQKIDGFICLEALAGKEVAQVLNNFHISDRVVVAMDTDEGTLDWVRKGIIAATIEQKPFTMAYVAMQTLDDVHHNKPKSLDVNWAEDPFSPFGEFVDTGATLIDRSNVDSFTQMQNTMAPGRRQ